MDKNGLLNVLNNDGQVIGQASRGEIHEKGLLHSEIHVWFFTPDQKIIFQHRAKDKDTFPDLLDATVGGHVEIGETFEQAAVKEIQEETGLAINPSDLITLMTTQTKSFDLATKTTNNAWRKVFAYRFEGDKNQLKVENGKSLGFESWPIDELIDPNFLHKDRFIPRHLEPESIEMFTKIRSFLAN
ncbi:MAG: NUDIX domain-containing protein [Candidatus Paceibacterota bacterium]|jgi:isopentenyldiphosphate isomerase